MNCPRCGMQLPDGSNLCPDCGLNADSAYAGQNSQEQQNQWEVYLPDFWKSRQNQSVGKYQLNQPSGQDPPSQLNQEPGRRPAPWESSSSYQDQPSGQGQPARLNLYSGLKPASGDSPDQDRSVQPAQQAGQGSAPWDSSFQEQKARSDQLSKLNLYPGLKPESGAAFEQDLPAQQPGQRPAPWDSPYEDHQGRDADGNTFTSFGQPQGHYTKPQKYRSGDPYQGYPVKWHKFLVYYSLWMAAISNGYYGIRYLTGGHWLGSELAIYSWFPGFKTTDLITGVACLVLSALGFVTAYKMLKLKRNAPTWLMLVYAASAFTFMLYTLSANHALGDAASSAFKEMAARSSYISSYMESLTKSVTARGTIYTIAYAVMVVINKIYYDRRQELFVH